MPTILQFNIQRDYIHHEICADYLLTNDDFRCYIRCSAIPLESSLLSSTTVSATTSTKIVKYGDVNLDGTVDNTDALLVQNYDIHAIGLTAEQLIAGDVDLDGSANIIDVLYIMKYAAGIISSLPVIA